MKFINIVSAAIVIASLTATTSEAREYLNPRSIGDQLQSDAMKVFGFDKYKNVPFACYKLKKHFPEVKIIKNKVVAVKTPRPGTEMKEQRLNETTAFIYLASDDFKATSAVCSQN